MGQRFRPALDGWDPSALRAVGARLGYTVSPVLNGRSSRLQSRDVFLLFLSFTLRPDFKKIFSLVSQISFVSILLSPILDRAESKKKTYVRERMYFLALFLRRIFIPLVCHCTTKIGNVVLRKSHRHLSP